MNTYETSSPFLPVYNQGEELQLGRTYIGFFHGREAVNESLNDWGFAGPVIGPIDYCHVTYLQTFRFQLAEDADVEAHRKAFGDNAITADDAVELTVEGDCIRIGQFLYGDWTVFVARKEES